MRKYALIFAIFVLAFATFSEAQTGQDTLIRANAADPSACTTSSGAFYWNTATKRFKGCTATNTWDTVPFVGQANVHAAGAKNTFTPSASTAGFNLVKLSGQPSSPADGDLNNNAGFLELFVTSAWKRFAYTDSNITGNAATASSLAANGTNCSPGQAPLGVDAQGNVENCFTPSVGIASALTSAGTNPAATGVVKLANNEKICWRKADNSTDLCIYLDASNAWNLDGASSTIFSYVNATAPGTPSAGSTSVYVDSTTKALNAKNDAGNASTTVFGGAAVSQQYVTTIGPDGVIVRKQVAYNEVSGTPVIPANTASTANQFITGYSNVSGAYTKAQPSTANLSDVASLILNTQNNNFGAFYHDIQEIAAPGNPGANTCRVWVDSTSHQMTGKTSTGTSCMPTGGGGGAVSSVSGDSVLYNNSSSTGAVVLTFANVLAHKFFGNGNGTTGQPGYFTLAKADLPSTIVHNDQVNTGTSAMSLDLSGSTVANAFRVPSLAGATISSDGAFAYDTTAGNLHVRCNGADCINGAFQSAPVQGRVVDAQVVSGNVRLHDSGVASSTLATAASTLAAHGPVVADGARGLVSTDPGTPGNCYLSNGPTVDPSFQSCPNGGGGGSGAPNYGTSFSGVTQIVIAGTSHQLNTKNLVVACYDNASPANRIEPASYTVNTSTFDVTVNFAVSTSGYCAVNGTGPAIYSASISSSSTWTVAAATHGLGVNLQVRTYDGSGNEIQPGTIAIDGSGNVTIAFAVAQAGKVVITQ